MPMTLKAEDQAMIDDIVRRGKLWGWMTFGDVMTTLDKQDAMLAKAADMLNVTPNMKAMDLGADITEYRRNLQKHRTV